MTGPCAHHRNSTVRPDDPSPKYLPETDLELLSEFRIGTPRAIQRLLADLAANRAPVSLYSAANPEVFVISRLESLDDEWLQLEIRTDSTRKRELLAPGRCTVVAFVNDIKVQFEVAFAAAEATPELVSLRTQHPAEVFRIQRRSAYRVRPPIGQTGQVTIRGEPGTETSFELMDLSATGLSFQRRQEQQSFEIGARHEHARIELRPRVPVPCTLEIKTIQKLEPVSGVPQGWRIGCALIDMPPEVERLVQTYVQDVERLLIRLRDND